MHEHDWSQVVSSLGWVKEVCFTDGCQTARYRRCGSAEWTMKCWACEAPLGELEAGPCGACRGARPRDE